MKKTFGIDVDEVLRSLLPEMVKLYNEYFGAKLTCDDIKNFDVDLSFPLVKQKMNCSASRWFFQEFGHRLFYESPLISGAGEAIRLIRERGDIVYIISYQKSISNKIDTLCWLANNYIEYDGVCFVKDKSIVGLDYLIDDNDWNFNNCNCKTAVLITAPYNKDFDLDEIKKKGNCKKILRYDSLLSFVKDLYKIDNNKKFA